MPIEQLKDLMLETGGVDGGHFIWRSEELQIAAARMELIGKQAFRQNILEFNGSPKTGKTALLGQVEVLADAYGIPHFLLSRDDFNLEGTDGVDILTIEARLKLWEKTGLLPGSPTSGSGRGVVLCLDEPPVLTLSDEKEANAARIVEQAIIAPFVKQGGLVVIASRAPTKFHDRLLWYKTYTRELPPFSLAETRLQLGVPEKTAELIQGLTKGYAGANVFVGQMMAKGCEDEKQLAASLVKEYVLPALMPGAPETWRKSFNFSGLIKALSCVRQFDVSVLTSMLKTLYPRDFGEKTGLWFLSLQGKIVESDLTERNPDKKGYVLDPLLGHMIKRDLELNQPDEYNQILYSARDAYADLAGRNDITLPIQAESFQEYLYYTALIKEELGPEKVAKASCEAVREFLSAKMDALAPEEFQTLINDLSKGISKDPDLAGMVWEQGITSLQAAICEFGVPSS